MDRNGNADVLPPLKSSTKGNVKAHESNVSGALPLVGGVQVQQLFEEETNQQNKGKVANEIQGLPSVHRPVSYSGNASPASGRRSSLNGSGSLKSRGLPMAPEQAMKQFMHKLTSNEGAKEDICILSHCICNEIHFSAWPVIVKFCLFSWNLSLNSRYTEVNPFIVCTCSLLGSTWHCLHILTWEQL